MPCRFDAVGAWLVEPQRQRRRVVLQRAADRHDSADRGRLHQRAADDDDGGDGRAVVARVQCQPRLAQQHLEDLGIALLDRESAWRSRPAARPGSRCIRSGRNRSRRGRAAACAATCSGGQAADHGGGAGESLEKRSVCHGSGELATARRFPPLQPSGLRAPEFEGRSTSSRSLLTSSDNSAQARPPSPP